MNTVLNEGDIITVKCRVVYGTTGWSGTGLAHVSPLSATYEKVTIQEEDFDRIVRRHFEVGQKVRRQTYGMPRGKIEFIGKSGDWLVVIVDGEDEPGSNEPAVWPANKCEPFADPDFDEIEEPPVQPPAPAAEVA